MEDQLGFKVGLQYKAICRGKRREEDEIIVIVRAIYVELSI